MPRRTEKEIAKAETVRRALSSVGELSKSRKFQFSGTVALVELTTADAAWAAFRLSKRRLSDQKFCLHRRCSELGKVERQKL